MNHKVYAETFAREEMIGEGTPGSRVAALDALRQIAAFIVLIHHFLLIFEINAPSWTQLGVLDAKAAVSLFFVLSGYVLALSLSKEDVSIRSYIKFGVRRIFRIYPLHFASMLLSFGILMLIKTQGGFLRELAIPVEFLNQHDVRQWILQLTLVMPGIRSDFANPPVWTLMVEAKIAAVFPLIAWLILKSSSKIAICVVLVLAIASDWSDRYLAGAVAFLGQFAIGAALTRMPNSMMKSWGGGQWVIWIVASLVLYSLVSFRYDFPSIWIAYNLCGLGAAGIIASVVRNPFLNKKLAGFQKKCGADISYGIYIFHFPVMLGLKKLFGNPEDVHFLLGLTLFFLVTLITFSISIILMRLIEIPAIRIGKALTA